MVGIKGTSYFLTQVLFVGLVINIPCIERIPDESVNMILGIGSSILLNWPHKILFNAYISITCG